MNDWIKNPTFIYYTITCLILTTNLLFLWVYSGFVRAKVKTTVNKEDASRFGGAAVTQTEPEPIARVLRAHTNAEANIYPFLFLGIIFVLAGGNATTAAIIFGVFALARLLHSFAFLKGLQPWRTIFFSIGALATLVLMVDITLMVIRVCLYN